MANTKHTTISPPPWKSGTDLYDGEAWLWIEDGQSASVCGVHDPDITDGSQDRANIEYIVQAVNAHAGLVAALQDFIDFSRDYTLWREREFTERLNTVTEQALAALAIARNT